MLGILKRAAVIATVTCAAACTHAPAALDLTGRREAYTFEARNGESVAAERGSFQVPENRADPNARLITLHYVRFPASAASPGSPLIYLAGGPGASGLSAAQGPRFPLFMALRELGDVIAFEQRGVGWSNQVPRCEGDTAAALDAPLGREETLAILRAHATHCVDFWASQGVDIRGYNTLESARDLDDLRRHLGAERVSLWGISYGTHLALAALKVMDNRIDRVVLASPEGLDQTVKAPAEADDYLGRLQAAIDADPAALAIYPDAAGLIRRVLARLDAEPALVTARDGSGGQTTFVMGGWEVRLLTAFGLADPSRAAQVLELYRAADAGEYGALAQQVYGAFRSSPHALQGMPELMDIASGISDADLARVAEQAPNSVFSDLLNFPMPHLREAFGPLDLGEGFRAPPRSARPTLVLSGTLDGRTFPNEHRAAVRGLGNVAFVTIENGGHNLYEADPRIQALVVAFLGGAAVEDHTITLPPPRFQ